MVTAIKIKRSDVHRRFKCGRVLTVKDCLEQRSAAFWALVRRSEVPGECWEWQGTFMTAGYGQFGFLNRNLGAHRFSYLLHGRDLEAGKVIRHLCDNKKCVNPEHLDQGTYAENAADRRVRDEEIEYWISRDENFAAAMGVDVNKGDWDWLEELI